MQETGRSWEILLRTYRKTRRASIRVLWAVIVERSFFVTATDKYIVRMYTLYWPIILLVHVRTRIWRSCLSSYVAIWLPHACMQALKCDILLFLLPYFINNSGCERGKHREKSLSLTCRIEECEYSETDYQSTCMKPNSS
jgi:hypothetical protein